MSCAYAPAGSPSSSRNAANLAKMRGMTKVVYWRVPRRMRMNRTRNLYVGAALLALLVALALGQALLQKATAAQMNAAVQAPRFEVDPLWPKPLPNHWVLGNTIGVSVDAADHVWIIHRAGSLEAKEIYAVTNPPGATCCLPAPPVLEFDQEGNLIGHCGGPGQGYD